MPRYEAHLRLEVVPQGNEDDIGRIRDPMVFHALNDAFRHALGPGNGSASMHVGGEALNVRITGRHGGLEGAKPTPGDRFVHDVAFLVELGSSDEGVRVQGPEERPGPP